MGKGARLLYGVFRLKRLVMGVAAVALAAAVAVGSAAFIRASAAGQGVALPVVMYHAVIDDSARLGAYVISPAELESDFRWLKQHGYTPVLSADLLAFVDRGEPLPEKPIMITFDDGYYNNYCYAFETAKQYGMKFVLSPIGQCADLYTEEPSENPYWAHATWEMLREMQDSGLVEIGNHTYDLHKSDGARLGTKQLSSESDAQYAALLIEDLTLFQQKAEAALGKAPVLFAYPFGAVSKGEPALVKSLGFRVTLSCEEHVSVVSDAESLYFLGRYLRPSGTSSEQFFSKFLND